MSQENSMSTETTILNAARTVFQQKGFEGARMQEIADAAGINKALLHYYFRSKDKLFEAVFNEAFYKFIPKITNTLNANLSLQEKLIVFVENYTNMLLENPFLPSFIISEINRNPDKIIGMITKAGIQPKLFINAIQAQLDKEGITSITAHHLLTNLIAMCIFPFAARPIVQGLLFENNSDAYNAFLIERKNAIPTFIINALRK